MAPRKPRLAPDAKIFSKKARGGAFPLEYYYEFSGESGRPALYPGLGQNLCDQPYFVLRSPAV